MMNRDHHNHLVYSSQGDVISIFEGVIGFTEDGHNFNPATSLQDLVDDNPL